MIETKVSLRHDTLTSIRNYLDTVGYHNTEIIREGLINIINMISDYHEEGTPLYPDVVLVDNNLFFSTFPSQIVKLHEGVLDIADFSMAIKLGAPLAIDGWVIYMLIDRDNHVEYGVITASLTQMSVSLYDQTITTPIEQCTAIYLRNIGNKIVEICSSVDVCTISLNLVENDLRLNDVVKKLSASILSDVSIASHPDCSEIANYLHHLIIDALNCGHGNLIAVTDDVNGLNATKGLKGGIFIEPTIDFVSLSMINKKNDSDLSSTTLQRYSSIVKAMINFDGITLFNTKGQVIGYHFIVDNHLVEEQRIVGGSRTRAFYALAGLQGIKSCFMKSQDGNLKFEKNE